MRRYRRPEPPEKTKRHEFKPSGETDWLGRPSCAKCPLPQQNRIHVGGR